MHRQKECVAAVLPQSKKGRTRKRYAEEEASFISEALHSYAVAAISGPLLIPSIAQILLEMQKNYSEGSVPKNVTFFPT